MLRAAEANVRQKPSKPALPDAIAPINDRQARRKVQLGVWWQGIYRAQIADTQERDRSQRRGGGPACYSCGHLYGRIGSLSQTAPMKKQRVGLVNVSVRELSNADGSREDETLVRIKTLGPLVQFLPDALSNGL
jgi:hypothetical protein